MTVKDHTPGLFPPRVNATVPKHKVAKATSDVVKVLAYLVEAPGSQAPSNELMRVGGHRAAARVNDLVTQHNMVIDGGWRGARYWYTLRSVDEAKALLAQWRA